MGGELTLQTGVERPDGLVARTRRFTSAGTLLLFVLADFSIECLVVELRRKVLGERPRGTNAQAVALQIVSAA